MHSRQSVESVMEHWKTPALAGHYCKEFSSRTNRSHLLLRKDEIRSNTLKSPSNNIRTNYQNNWSWSKNPKNIKENKQKAITSLIFESFSKTLLTTKRKLIGK